MNIRYPIYEGVYRILTMTSQIYAPEIFHSSGTDLNVCLLKTNEC